MALQTALVYLSNQYTMRHMEGNKNVRVKAHYIAVPLRVQTYVDLGAGIKHKAFLGLGVQLAYLLSGDISYNFRGHNGATFEEVKWIDLKENSQSTEIKNWATHFLIGVGYKFLGRVQVSIEGIRRLNTLARCSNTERDLWFCQLGISYNLAKLF